ncbi:apolipoprotein N-acyltransferase [Fibrobacteres bacterium R8-0-B4]
MILKKIDAYYTGANRFWIPILCGLLYSLGLPPFSGMLHAAFTPMPLLSFAALIPLFYFATRAPRRRALIHTYLHCAAMTLGQYYWIGFDTADGFWILILIGVALISIVWGALYFAAALAFRYSMRRLPRLYIIVYPAVWVLVEYFRTTTDLAFPWSFLGYSAAGILPFAQLASVTGVWGLSYIIVVGNIALWELLRAYKSGVGTRRRQWREVAAWAALTIAISVWGAVRMSGKTPQTPVSKIAVMQSHMDQFHWGRGSLDTAVTVSDSMVRAAAKSKPELIIFSESALMCYLDRRPDIMQNVLDWAKDASATIIAGALHLERPKDAAGPNDYDAYNTAFLTDVDNDSLLRYSKILLVPFSEIMPFEANFPILSRVNLGGSSFKRGESESVFRINEKLEIAPYICYEIIFPDFVRRRLKESTNMLVQITNDGWFGRTSGPYQHAVMAQTRSIENGITLARAANSGISMIVDQYGRITEKTGLYTRDMIVRDVCVYRVKTLYNRFGDWFVWLCAGIVIVGIAWIATVSIKSKFLSTPKST